MTVTLFFLGFTMLWPHIRADEKSQALSFSCRGMDISKSLNFSIKYSFRACVIQHSQHNSFDVSLSHCPAERCQTELWWYGKTHLEEVNQLHGVMKLITWGLYFYRGKLLTYRLLIILSIGKKMLTVAALLWITETTAIISGHEKSPRRPLTFLNR